MRTSKTFTKNSDHLHSRVPKYLIKSAIQLRILRMIYGEQRNKLPPNWWLRTSEQSESFVAEVERMSRIPMETSSSRPQFLTSGHECVKCSGETGMFFMSVDEDCDFSFDLCFGCADVAIDRVITSQPHHLETSEIVAKRGIIVDRKLANNPPIPIPVNSSLLIGRRESDTIENEINPHETNSSILQRRHNNTDLLASRDICRRHPLRKVDDIKNKICQPCHQLVAVVKGCDHCTAASGISLVCVDDDCEFSFDLCFGCGEGATSKGCKSAAQPRIKQLHIKANLSPSQSSSI